MAASVYAMIGRVTGFYARTEHAVPVFAPVEDRSFTFAGRDVTITDEADPGSAPGEVVVVRYGDRELPLRPTIKPLSAQVPALRRHESWLAVLRFVEKGRPTGAETERAIATGEALDRLVIVVRDPHLALDGTAHGQGRPSDWTFDLHELLTDGEFRMERFGYPLSPRAARAAENAGAAAGVPPLREGSWQYYAALMTIPKGSKPTPAFTRDAVRAMGWTLPAAAFSGLVLTLSIPWLLYSGRRG